MRNCIPPSRSDRFLLCSQNSFKKIHALVHLKNRTGRDKCSLATLSSKGTGRSYSVVRAASPRPCGLMLTGALNQKGMPWSGKHEECCPDQYSVVFLAARLLRAFSVLKCLMRVRCSTCKTHSIAQSFRKEHLTLLSPSFYGKEHTAFTNHKEARVWRNSSCGVFNWSKGRGGEIFSKCRIQAFC